MEKVSRGVSIRFQGVDLALGNRLFKLSGKHGMFPERLVILALYVGLQVVDDQLTGIRLDMDAAGYSLTSSGKYQKFQLEREEKDMKEFSQVRSEG